MLLGQQNNKTKQDSSPFESLRWLENAHDPGVVASEDRSKVKASKHATHAALLPTLVESPVTFPFQPVPRYQTHASTRHSAELRDGTRFGPPRADVLPEQLNARAVIQPSPQCGGHSIIFQGLEATGAQDSGGGTPLDGNTLQA